jgi:hypothetical protein
VPFPVAAEVVQLVQAMFSTPKPLSAHASVMPTGRMLSWCGARMQSATTPGTGPVVEGAGLAGDLAGGGVVTDDGAAAVGCAETGAVVVLTGIAVGIECGPAAMLALLAPHAAKARLDPSSEQIASAMCEGRAISVLTPEGARRLVVSRSSGGIGEAIARRLAAKAAAVSATWPALTLCCCPTPWPPQAA